MNIQKEVAREEAQTPPDTSGEDAPEVEQTEAAIVGTAVAGPPQTEPAADEIDEYPIEDTVWEGEMGRYTEMKHLSRTMHPMGGLDERVMSPRDLNEKLEDDYFAKGFELIKILPQGFGPDGVSVLYVLGKVREDLQSKHKEIWHIQRTLTERAMQSGGVTGFQADKYIKSFLSEGWQLFAVNTLKDGDVEIPMLWVLVR